MLISKYQGSAKAKGQGSSKRKGWTCILELNLIVLIIS